MNAQAIIDFTPTGNRKTSVCLSVKFKLPLPLWHFCSGDNGSDSLDRPKCPEFTRWVCAHTHTTLTHVFDLSVGQPLTGDAKVGIDKSDQMEAHVDGTWGNEKRDACDQEEGDRRVSGWTTAHPLCSKSEGICSPLWLLLVQKPESWERGFQLHRADDKQAFFFFLFVFFFSKSSSQGFLLLFLCSLFFLAVSPFCSGCTAQSAPASYSIICEWLGGYWSSSVVWFRF